MKNYYRDLLVCWTLIMIWYGDIVTKLVSKNPMIPYLIITFVCANLVVCAVNLTVKLIKSGKR